MNPIVRGLLEHQAVTRPDSEDERLRGRTYTIPFDTVWEAALRIADRGIMGWTLARSDDRLGHILALARTPLVGWETDVRIAIGLDQHAQTRVDAEAISRTERGDFGRGRRHLARFQKRLDKELGARPEQILDPTRLHIYEANP